MRLLYYSAAVILSFILFTGFTFSQESEGIFPLWKSLAKGKDLPAPFGFGLNIYAQDQTFNFSKSSFYLSGLNLENMIPQDLDISNQVTEKNFKVDLWLLPFVNVFGILGEINGSTIVDHELLNQISDGKIQMNYKGVIYGSGITMAGGYEPYFLSLTAAFSNTRLDNSESSVKAWVFTPKVGIVMKGWRIIEDLNIWLGAMYQKSEEQHSGSINLANSIDVQYDVTLEQKNAWNSMAGVMIGFSGDFCLELERGIGDRKHVLASLIYRI